MPTVNLLLNSSNNNGNALKTYFVYNFSNGSFYIPEGSEVCLSNITIPYSWFNISKFYNNTNFTYNYPNATGGFDTYSFDFQDGFYTQSDINNYIHNYMISQSQYLIDDNGNYVFFINFFVDTAYYANQFILQQIPISLPAGWSSPTGYITPLNQDAPQVVFNSTGGLNSICGFSAGTYPPTVVSSTDYSILSNITPNATNVNDVVIRTNLAYNFCSNPTDVLDAFNVNGSFGSNLAYYPNYEKWINVKSGTYNNFFVYLQDQNLGQIQANDTNVLISLLLRIPNIIPKQMKLIKPIEFNDEMDTEGKN